MRAAVIAELTEIVLAAGLDPARWADVPRAIVERFPGTKASVIGEDSGTGRGLGGYEHGFGAEAVDAFYRHFARINPWERFWTGAPTMVAFASEERSPSSRFAETEFYRDWLAPLGEAECGAGIKILDEPGAQARLTVHYGRRRSPAYDAELTEFLQILAPALRTAVTLNRRLARPDLAGDGIRAVLACLDAPAVLVDSGRRILSANADGEAELGAGLVLRELPGRRIGLVGPAGRPDLPAAIAAATGQGGRAPSDAEIVLPVAPGGGYGSVTVVPVVPAREPAASAPWQVAPPRLALLLLRRGGRAADAGEGGVGRGFGLTPAEARVAARIAAGRSLPAIAAELGIGRETARTHLKHVFAKTGTRRQAELAVLLNQVS